MLTIYLIGFACVFAFYWIFLSQKDYEESTDMFCSLVFSTIWPLLLGAAIVGLVIWPIEWLYKNYDSVVQR